MKTKGSKAAMLREIIVQAIVSIFLAIVYGLILICH